MKCKNTSRLMIDKLAGELSKRQEAKLEKHLNSCIECQKEFEELSQIWQVTNDTLNSDDFSLELSPDRRSEIFGIAEHEAKRKKTPLYVKRIMEIAVVIVICFVLAGMFLPALNQAREKSKRISAQSRLKMAKMEEMQRLMDAKNKTAATPAKAKVTIIPMTKEWRAKMAGATNNLGGAPVQKTQPFIAPADSKGIGLDMDDRYTKAKEDKSLSEQDKYSPQKDTGSKLKWSEMAAPAPAAAPFVPAADVKNTVTSHMESSRRVEEVCVKDEIAPAPQELRSSRKITEKRPNVITTYEIPASKIIVKKQRLPIKTFKVNLKLWNMTTPANVREYLRQNNYPANVFIRVNKHNNTIRVSAPKAVIKKLEKLFNRLQREEKELKDLSNGLPFIKSSMRPVSTFSIDTDTASYVQARKRIKRGERPDPLKIRPEEFINYFDYNYRSPHKTTFAVYLEAAPSPFRQQNTLFRIGIQGKRLGPSQFTRSHYVILLDTSGSMAVKDRMELGKKAVAMLLNKLKSSDYISLLVCGDKTSPVFSINPLTSVNRQRLLSTLNAVSPHGTTDFAEGISEAYKFADKYFLPHYSNKVIIISDGIFELNDAGRRTIDKQIETARKRGISNIVIGLGGDGDDTTLEKVAAKGDGSYVFLDNEREAKELFTTNFEARFREIARDVKIQVSFNPDVVESYRQIGYKNRQLSKADFRNDKVDAGEVGSGQSVTALYELKLKPELPKDMIAATVRIRYKRVDDLSVEEKAFNLYYGDIKEKFSTADPAFKLAAFVSEFAEALRYPETRNIASTRAIADELRKLWSKDYHKDVKVIELLKLIKRSK